MRGFATYIQSSANGLDFILRIVVTIICLGLVVVSEPTPALRRSVDALASRVQAVTGHAPLSEHQCLVLARSSWDAEDGRWDGHTAFGVVAQ